MSSVLEKGPRRIVQTLWTGTYNYANSIYPDETARNEPSH